LPLIHPHLDESLYFSDYFSNGHSPTFDNNGVIRDPKGTVMPCDISVIAVFDLLPHRLKVACFALLFEFQTAPLGPFFQ
jgi:hypothetical protein